MTNDKSRASMRSPIAGWMTSTAAVAAAALLAACGDATTAPASAERLALAPTAAPQQTVWSAGDTTYTRFTYNPGSALEQGFANAHRLSMPAGAVCDPSTAGYGVGTWDSACTPLAQPITFTSKAWYDAAGRPHLTFSPDVRFVPGKVVTLRLKDAYAADRGIGTLAWCPTGGTTCVNEAASDASLTTYFSKNELFVYRRLKHFSGYQIILGREGEEPPPEGTY